MSDKFDKKIRLQALQNLRDKNLAKNRFSSSDMNKFDLERGKNLSKGQLDNDSFVAKGSKNPDITPSRTVVGKTDKINNIGDKQNLISGNDFVAKQKALEKERMLSRFKKAAESGDTNMMNALRERAKGISLENKVPETSLRKGLKPLTKGLKSIPIIGTLAALAGSEDASAAIPILDSADSAGMSGADENQMMAEIQGRKDYEGSQAAEDAKRNKLAVLSKLAELKGNQ
jgi:hypothetical protein